MKLSNWLSIIVLTAGISAISVPAQAQLLGGLLGGGGGGGGNGGGGGGGGSVGDLVDLDSSDDGSIGVKGVLTVAVSSGSGGTNAKGTVLGGGGDTDINIPLGNLLGGNSNVGVDLPGLGGLLGGTPGAPGGPGTPGGPGAPGAPGTPGGINFANLGGGGAGGFTGISGSSRLQALIAMLQNRAWLRFAQGNKVCLANFGVANAATYVRRSEQAKLQQLIAAFGNDIMTLQEMMKRCRNGQNRLVDISRVIGVDLRPDGQIVVYTI